MKLVVDILTLALESGVPLWSNETDFEEIDEITLFETKEVIELVRFLNADK